MDDGDQKWKKRSNAVRISTNCFTEYECCVLQQVLIHRYGFKVSSHKAEKTKLGTQRYRLYIHERCFTDFKSVVLLELLPSMMYKMPGSE